MPRPDDIQQPGWNDEVRFTLSPCIGGDTGFVEVIEIDGEGNVLEALHTTVRPVLTDAFVGVLYADGLLEPPRELYCDWPMSPLERVRCAATRTGTSVVLYR